MAKIAVCDDSTKYRRNTVDYLNEQGFSAFGFETPDDLMDLINYGFEFDCILMDLYFDDDYQKPQLLGIEAGTKINPQNHAIDQFGYSSPGTPIIFISGNLNSHATSEDAENYESKCFEIGIFFMTKPVKYKVLLSQIKRAIQISQPTKPEVDENAASIDKFRLDELNEVLANTSNDLSASVRNQNLENLKTLMGRAGELVTYEELGGPESAHTSIYALRSIISNELRSKAKPIRTVQTKGYKWLQAHGTL